MNRIVVALLLGAFVSAASATVTVVDDATGGGSQKTTPDKPVIRPVVSALAETASVENVAERREKPQVWVIDPAKDHSYHDVLQQWAEKSGWSLVWQVQKPFEPRNKSTLTGDFTDVFTKVLTGLARVVGPFDIKFWRGNKVITVAMAPPMKIVRVKKGSKVPFVSEPAETSIAFLDDAFIDIAIEAPKEVKQSTVPPTASAAASKSVERVMPVLPVWSVDKGEYLGDVFRRWADRAGWTYEWALPPQDDFQLGAKDSYTGEFQDVIRELVESLPVTVRIQVHLVPENNPPLLYVTREEKK